MTAGRRATDQVVLTFTRPFTPREARSAARDRGLRSGADASLTFVRLLDPRHGVYRLRERLGEDAPTTLASLRAIPGVALAEPDEIVGIDALPDDPRAADLWGLVGPSDGSDHGIDALGAWSTTRGAGVTVAVIDTGLVAHPDLAGQTIAGYDFVSDAGIAGDGTGRDADPSDPGCPGGGTVWHGTHVTGTIAAIADNGIGVFGGAPEAKVLVVRALGGCGSGYMSDAADAIRWAAGGSVAGVPSNTHPAQVLNLSLTAGAACESYVQAAVDDARGHGAVVVAAAGNDNVDSGSFEPASCTGVVSVAAIDSAGLKASFSNFGPGVTVAGPGVGVWSTANDGTTGPGSPEERAYNGTSMASPHVAATAALVLAGHPGLTPDAVALAITNTATAFGPDGSPIGCPALGCGAGIANASGALTALAGPAPIVGLVRMAAPDVLPAGSATVTALAVLPAGVTGGQWSIDGGGWSAMTAVDGTFGGATERLTATFTAPSTQATHAVCVRAVDAGAHLSDGTACTSLRVNAGPPSVTVPLVDPSPAANGVAVTVSADASDPNGVGAAEVRIDAGVWQPLAAADGAFDEPAETATGRIGGAVTHVSAGQFHSCGLLADGSARCWGVNSSGQLGDGTTTMRLEPVAVEGLDDAIAISAGTFHTCALGAAGMVSCWGDNSNGQLGDGTTTMRLEPVPVAGVTGATAVASAYRHTCALIDDGSVRCWGADAHGALGDGVASSGPDAVTVTGLDDALTIAAGLEHTCAIRADETVWCWGRNAAGQLGDGTRIDRSAPVQVGGLVGATAIAAGDAHTCAVLEDTTVRCWGENAGQLGDGTTTDRLDPVAVIGLTGVTAIAAGQHHTCTVSADESVHCWGGNRRGQLSDGTTTWSLVPVLVRDLPGITSLAAGMWHTCGIADDGTARCWGNNWNGQFGDGTRENPLPNTVVAPSAVAGIGALGGGTHSICVRASDVAGKTSAGTTCSTLVVSDAVSPSVASFRAASPYANGTTLAFTLRFRESVTGLSAADFTIGGTSSGWSVGGVSGSGQAPWTVNLSGPASTAGTVTISLKAGSVVDRAGNSGPSSPRAADAVTIDRTRPTVANPTLTPALAASGGASAISALTGDPAGVAGAETRIDGGGWRPLTAADGAFGGPSETAIGATGGRITELDAGSWDTCALLEGGTVRCFGGNDWGVLGNGTTVEGTSPVEVHDLAGVTAVAVDERHACAVVALGAVRCWGDNESGQLGDGTITDRLTPVDVPDLSSVVELATGVGHTCARLDDGTVRCWGMDLKGQLGHGPIPDSPAPVVALGVTNASAIAAGYLHTCALLGDGTVMCWGDNEFGQLGDGTTTNRSTAVPVTGLDGVVAIAAGSHMTCALIDDGTVRCWGWNAFGGIGDGTTTNRSVPTAVPGLTGVSAIATSAANTCAVRTDGTARCWGANPNGELGDGTTVDHHTPAPVVGVTGIATMTLGGGHTCALLMDGGARCWGQNVSTYGSGGGRLGDGTTTDRLTPVAPLGIGSLAGGSHSVCVRATDGATNTSTGSACTTLTVDASPPTATLVPVLAATNAATVSWTLTFGEPVSSLGPTDLTIAGSATGCAIDPPSGGASSWTIAATGCSEGTVTLRLTAGSVVDAVGNGGPPADVVAATVTIDRTEPGATITAPASPTAASTLTYLVDLDEPIAALTAGDLVVTGTATGCSVASPTGAGAAWVVSVTGCSEGTVVLTLATGAVSDAAGNTGPDADVSADAVTVDRGPAVTLTCVPGSGPTRLTSIPCSATFAESPGGGSFTALDILIGGSATGWTSDAPVGTGSGPYTFHVSGSGPDGSLTIAVGAGAVTDSTGNPSLASATIALTIDRTVPKATTPTITPKLGAVLGTSTMPVHLGWSGSDGSGSGIAGYTLARSTNGGSTWTTISSTLTTPGADLLVSVSGTTRFRVRAVDRAGNAGSWVTSPSWTPRLAQQTSTSVHYGGRWATSLSSSLSGGSSRYATAAGAWATYTFTGRSIALVSTMAPTRGKVRIYVGATLVATVDLSSATWRSRVLVWQRTWTTSATRTVKLVVVGTAGRPRVDLDAFATIR